MRHDRTKPIPAPEGYKWVVCETVASYREHCQNGVPMPAFSLCLFPEHLEVDTRHGYALGKPRKKSDGVWAKGSRPPIFPRISGFFRVEKQIYRLSRKLVREFEQRRINDSRSGEITGEL